MNLQSRALGRQTILFLLAAGSSMTLFLCSYQFDNKYAAGTNQPIGGVLFSSQEGVSWLINGWQYYEDRLLTPEDFFEDPPLPDRYVSIGQYPTMNHPGHPDNHGSASYRLLLSLPDEPQSYTLELPEIYSSYCLYINNRLMAYCGDPRPADYKARLCSKSLTFEASGDTSLLISVSDWNYLYSGMVYPPAFGSPDAVSQVLDIRYTWYMFLLSLAFILGCFQFGLSFLFKNRKALYSALVCFCFCGMVLTPPLHRLYTTQIAPLYNLELFCRYGIYGFSVLLITKMCGKKDRLSVYFVLPASLFPWAAAIMPSAASWITPSGIHAFSYAAAGYKVLCCIWMLYMIFTEGQRSICRKSSFFLLTGAVSLASSLAADRLLPMFEPICFGWFSEQAGFIFCICVSLSLLSDSLEYYRRQIQIKQEREQMALQIRMQKEHYRQTTKQMESIRIMHHDIRHHLTKLSLLLSEGKYAESLHYLESLSRNTDKAAPLSFCRLYEVDVLLRYYFTLAEKDRITVYIQADVPDSLGVAEDDLSVIIGNLFENALEASRKIPVGNRSISFVLLHKNGTLIIKVSNYFSGNLISSGDGYYSAGNPGRKGLGIPSVKAMVEKYDGNVWIDTEGDGDIRMFIIQAFLLCP